MVLGGRRRAWDVWRVQYGNLYITICKIDTQWELAVWLRDLKLGLCNNLERWDGMERGSKGKGHRYTYGCVNYKSALTKSIVND